MAQRGGAVVSHLRLSAQPIASDLIPLGAAHMILSMEPMEALRYLPYARRDAVLVTNRNPVRNIAGYPDEKVIEARTQRMAAPRDPGRREAGPAGRNRARRQQRHARRRVGVPDDSRSGRARLSSSSSSSARAATSWTRILPRSTWAARR